jgi:glycosyl transferase family 25
MIAPRMLVLINLDAAVQRRQAMARQLEIRGCAFERVGIDLRRVPDAEVDAQTQARFPGLRFDRKVLSNAEVGCWLSHLTAWQALLARPADPCAAVIEDDLRLAPGFGNAVEALSRRGDFDLVYLGTSSRNVSLRRYSMINGLAVHEPVGVIYNTWGYSIARGYVEEFFDAGPRTIRLPIDHFLGGRGGRDRPRIGVLRPAVVEEDPVLGVASQIGPHTRRLDRSRFFEEARRRLLASPVSELYYSLYRYL